MTHPIHDHTLGARLTKRPASALSNSELYLRASETLLASWKQYADGADGAALHRFAGVATAVFPTDPERGVYNNALLERDLAATERADAIAAMEAAYDAVGVTRFAAWVHESDTAMRSDLELRGYTLDEVTRAMGMTLDGIRLPRPELELERQTGPSTCASPGCRRASSAASIPPPSMSLLRASATRRCPSPSRSTSAPTAAYTTSERWQRPADAGWPPP